MNATQEQLNALFPTPRPSPPSNFAPARHPGWDHGSTETVLELLKDNHKRWHIFFNDMGFHNHASHHLLSIYAMGANSTTLKAAYETHVVYMKMAFKSPGPISQTNWKDHLGEEAYYQSYLAFFSALLLSCSIQTVLEDYIISKDANIVPGEGGRAPMMLSRFFAGFLHALIHVGYGAEFGLPGLVAEGLAQAAAHDPEAVSLFPAELFETTTNVASKPTEAQSAVHALAILARIANGKEFTSKALNLPVPSGERDSALERVARIAGSKLTEYTEEWRVGTSKEALEAKFEEVAWMNTLVYAVGGWAGRKQCKDEKNAFNADFFLMHLVTSSLFMPSLLGVFTPSSASFLLRTYFVLSLVLYAARGRPPLPIGDFYAETAATPYTPGANVQSVAKTLPPAATPNSWLPIIQTTLVHPDEHLCKLQRALVHLATLYGGSPAGRFASLGKDDLKGLKVLDGTLFVRAAGLTADRLGWMREGQKQRSWDMGGFFSSAN